MDPPSSPHFYRKKSRKCRAASLPSRRVAQSQVKLSLGTSVVSVPGYHSDENITGHTGLPQSHFLQLRRQTKCDLVTLAAVCGSDGVWLLRLRS